MLKLRGGNDGLNTVAPLLPLWQSRRLAMALGVGLALGPAGCPAMEGGAALALQLSPAELNGRALAGVDPAMPE